MHTVLMQRPLCTRRCIFERCISAIVKDDTALIDMSMLTGDEEDVEALVENGKSKRPPPMSPDAFKELLQTGQFGGQAHAWLHSAG